MKITQYAFGNIVVEGTTYTSDLIIYPDHVNSSWWRKEGHLLQKEDLKDIIPSGISILVVGTGYYANLSVPDETIDYIASKKILLHVKDTQKAVRLYNEISEKHLAIAALHLTC